MMRHRWYYSKRPGGKFDEWNDDDTGSMYFPYAKKFMAKFPRLAVRVFYVLFKIRKFFKR